MMKLELFIYLSIGALIAFIFEPGFQPVHAAVLPFQQSFVRLDRIKASTATTGRVCAKPSVTNLASAEAFVEVDFPAGFSLGAAGTFTVSVTNLDSGQTAWPGILTATVVTSQTVRFPSTDLVSSSTLYCFNFTGGVTTSAAANNLTGQIRTRLTGPGITIDQSDYSESIITNDQIVVTTAVGAAFTFALSGNTDSFGANLDSTLVRTSTGQTVTITSNAAQGWTLWAKNLNAASADPTKGALKSASVPANTIPASNANILGSASHTVIAGTSDYGLAATITTDAAGGGTVALDAAYDGTGSKAGVLDITNYRPVAASTGGTSNGDVITLRERATISATTPPATDYSDTITIVGAGSF